MITGFYRHLVRLQDPGDPMPDAEGNPVATWMDLIPATWWVSINPATARDLERVTAGTVLSTASHVIRGKFHPGVTTQTRILFGTRTFNVTGVSNPEERNIEMILTAVEIVE